MIHFARFLPPSVTGAEGGGCRLEELHRETFAGVTLLGAVRSVRGTFLRTLVLVFLATFLWLQLHVISLTGRDTVGQTANETLFALVPQELHR